MKKRIRKDPSLLKLEIVKVISCPVCGSNDVNDIIEIRLSGRDVVPFGVVTSDIPILFSCNSCGYEWTNPEYEQRILAKAVGL